MKLYMTSAIFYITKLDFGTRTNQYIMSGINWTSANLNHQLQLFEEFSTLMLYITRMPHFRIYETNWGCRLILSNLNSEQDFWVNVNFVQIWNDISVVFHFHFSKAFSKTVLNSKMIIAKFRIWTPSVTKFRRTSHVSIPTLSHCTYGWIVLIHNLLAWRCDFEKEC